MAPRWRSLLTLLILLLITQQFVQSARDVWVEKLFISETCAEGAPESPICPNPSGPEPESRPSHPGRSLWGHFPMAILPARKILPHCALLALHALRHRGPPAMA